MIAFFRGGKPLRGFPLKITLLEYSSSLGERRPRVEFVINHASRLKLIFFRGSFWTGAFSILFL